MSDAVGHVIGRGGVADFLTRLSFPVYALPGRKLYRVLVRGHSFSLPIAGGEAAESFFITYFIAARTRAEAESDALRRARKRWDTFYVEARGSLELEIEETEPLGSKWRRRSRSGISFYGPDPEHP